MSAAGKETPTPESVTVRGSALRHRNSGRAGRTWNLDALAGRFVEITSHHAPALLTLTTSLILQAQLRGSLAAWVGDDRSMVYPPDLADAGIDLEALPVVRIRSGADADRATDALLRSGGFALVVLDLGEHYRLSMAAQTRLSGLARKYHAVLLCLTSGDRARASLGSLVSVRGEIIKKRTAFNHFTCQLSVVKDKCTGSGWTHTELCRGPDGLC